MLATSLKQKIDRVLSKDKKFGKSVKTKSGIKGLHNISSGYTFTKLGDHYYLFWTCGNMVFRGMPIEEQDKKTEEIYRYLVEQGFGEYLEMDEIYRQKGIKLKHSA